MLKNIYIGRVLYYLAKWIKVIYSVVYRSLFFPQFLLMLGSLRFTLFLVLWLCCCCVTEVDSWFIIPFRHLYTRTHLCWKCLFSSGIHFREANACDTDEYSGRSKIILATLFCKTCRLDIKVTLCLSPQTRSANLNKGSCRPHLFP